MPSDIKAHRGLGSTDGPSISADAKIPSVSFLGEINIEKMKSELHIENNLISVSELVGILEERYNYAIAKEIKLSALSLFNSDKLTMEQVQTLLAPQKNQLWVKFCRLNNHVPKSEEDILLAFKHFGLNFSLDEARYFRNKMNSQGEFVIGMNDWRQFLLLHPYSIDKSKMNIWREHASFLDIGEDFLIPDDFSEHEKISGFWWRQLASGAGAGIVSRTCTAPLDRLKVLMQTQSLMERKLRLLEGFKGMLAEGGVLSLWRGNGVNVLKIAPETSIKFYAYETVKSLINENTSELTVGQRFLAGSLAGSFAQTAIYPLEVVKTRLAIAHNNQYAGLWDCVGRILSGEGVRGFFKGWVPNMLGILPYAGIDLTIYETSKNEYLKRYHPNSHGDPGVFLPVACGTFSCTCGQLCCYPLSLVRTRLQARVVNKVSMVQIFKEIINTDGILGLYRGLYPNCLKVVPAVSISYLVYERLRTGLGVYRG
ncbi:Calcium-binding mitochondrial carrier protein SCaMC-1 isoform X2 [Oopsacas minuta]|uniref:Calcium-binding mitochondrial carrier protein SCaMC-1 isoform X2 n=1 Tax=Oopsacas minuta TaxID=111878 RepID=A0AAV7JV39_9METZ|nr:Calcium-binding mitochondrial carrier protein SCaMC-1 isoform X2 [Oopsacas minuta]